MTIAAAPVVLADVWGFHHDDVGVGWGLVMTLVMVLFWGLVIFGVIALIRGGRRGRDDGSGDPGEVLKHRLASGEITVEEYQRRQAVIEGRASSGEPSGQPGTGSSG